MKKSIKTEDKVNNLRKMILTSSTLEVTNYIDSLDDSERKLHINMLVQMMKYEMEKCASTNQEIFGSMKHQLAIDPKDLADEKDKDLFQTLEDSKEDKEAKENAKEGKSESRRNNKSSENNKDSGLSGSSIPTHTTVLDPVITHCPHCGAALAAAGMSTNQKIYHIPGFTFIDETQDPIMECPNCTDDNGNSLRFSRGKEDNSLMPGSPVTPSMVAYIAMKTYLEGEPLYRLQKALSLQGIHLSRQVMVNWLDYAWDNHLVYFVAELLEALKEAKHVDIDESKHTVVENRKKRVNNYEIVAVTGRSVKNKIVFYMYSSTRSTDFVYEILGTKNTDRLLQSDGYAGYKKYAKEMTNTTHSGCWIHALVYFKKALSLDSKYVKICEMEPARQLKELDKHEDLRDFARIRDLISLMLQIDEQLDPSLYSWEEIRVLRLERIKPIMETIFEKAEKLKPRVPGKGKKGTAINYLLNQKDSLMAVLEAGELEMSNMEAERRVKSFVLWRKNSLFSYSEAGAVRASGYMTILHTAAANGLDPERYLAWLTTQLMTIRLPDGKSYRALFPFSENIPDNLRADVLREDLVELFERMEATSQPDAPLFPQISRTWGIRGQSETPEHDAFEQ